MPTYEYLCKTCDHRFEQLVRSMSDQSKQKCPKCGSTQTARALSVFAVGAEQLPVTADTSAAVVGFQLHFNTLAKAELMGLFKH